MTESIKREQTIGGIIDRVRRSDILEGVPPTKEQADMVYQRGYTDGYIEGKKQGFQEGIAWVKGK